MTTCVKVSGGTYIRIPIQVRARLKATAAKFGKSEKSFLIQMIETESDRVLGGTIYNQLKDVIVTIDRDLLQSKMVKAEYHSAQ